MDNQNGDINISNQENVSKGNGDIININEINENKEDSNKENMVKNEKEGNNELNQNEIKNNEGNTLNNLDAVKTNGLSDTQNKNKKENNKYFEDINKIEENEVNLKKEKEGTEEEKKENKKEEKKEEKKQEKKQEKKEDKKEGKNGDKKKDKKDDKKEETNKINIPEGFTLKDQEKINEYNNSNYQKLYSTNHFCDYKLEGKWRAGFITKITGDNLDIYDVVNKNPDNIIIPKQIKRINDSNNISYFRKYSNPDNYMVKGTTKNLKNKLLQFTNFHNNFKDYLEFCDDYEFYYFLRATVYYGLDFCMNPNINKNDVETSFRIILIILNIICDCLKYISENLEDFLKYQNEIKNSEYGDYVLISKKYAIYSFFDDIHYLIKKIFCNTKEYLEWYIKFENEISKFNPSITDNLQSSSVSELFPLYIDQKGGNNKFKLMKRTCLPEVYNKYHYFYNFDKKINSYIIAYFVDYFSYFGGYKSLFNILCSIYHHKNNYATNFELQNLIIDDLYTAKIITGSFIDFQKKDKNEQTEEIKNINKYMDNYTDKFDDEETQQIYEGYLNILFQKLVDLIQRNEEEKKILEERLVLIYLFKQLNKTKKLEKNITLITNLNNIIKSVKYNNIYKEIKENFNPNYNEVMLNDKEFQNRNKNITKMTKEYFCQACQDHKIIELFLDNQATHEEIIKRLYPLLLIMYSYNRECNENNSKNIKSMDSHYIFSTLFQKLKECEKNNESLWKIILLDIILEFSGQLIPDDKNFVFELIKKYFNETTIKKTSKIIQLFSFMINYTLKCIDTNIKNANEKDLIYENGTTRGNYEDIIMGIFNEKKFYCLQFLINHLINKSIIDELQINNDLKISIINTCIDGIIEILKKFNFEQNITKIVFIKVMKGILSSTNTIQNISLLEKILNSNINKNEINQFYKEEKIIKGLFDELLNYIKNNKEEKENNIKIELEKRLDFIFLLLENDIINSYEDFKNLFNELTNYNKLSKEILYSKIKKNVLKINPNLQKYICENILLKSKNNAEINDFMTYQLLKEFILQINKSNNIFKFITENEIIVQLKNNCEDIYGYNQLFNILIQTKNKDIKNDICNFLTNIYLGIRFNTIEEYKKNWIVIINKIKYNLKEYTPKDKIDNNAVGNLMYLIKKITEESNKDGDIITYNRVIDNLFETLKTKKEDPKEKKKDVKNGKKEAKEELNRQKNEECPIKIRLEYYEFIKNENPGMKKSTKMFDIFGVEGKTEKRTNICEIYQEEFFFHLRYYISYQFKIPLKCIQIKRINNQQNASYNSSDKKNKTVDQKNTIKYNLFNDCMCLLDVFPDLKQSKKKKEEKEENLPSFLIEKIQNPLNDDKEDNLKNQISKNEDISNILKNLLKNKNNDFGINIRSIISDKKEIDKGKDQEINKLINDIINNPDNKNDVEKDVLLNDLFNFDDSNIFYMNHILSLIYNYLKKNDKTIIQKFINCNIWRDKIINLTQEININNNEDTNKNKYSSVNELSEDINYENILLKIYILVVNNISDDNQTLDLIVKKIFDIIYSIINNCLSIDFDSFKKQSKDEKDIINVKKIYNNMLTDIINLFETNDNYFLSFLKILLSETPTGNTLKEKFEFCFTNGVIKSKYPFYTDKIEKLLLTLINNKLFEENNDINKLQKNFYLYICSIFYNQKKHDSIIQALGELLKKGSLFTMFNINKYEYEYNLKLYQKTISEILLTIYDYVYKDFDFNGYIFEKVIPAIYKPLLKDIKKENNIHDCFFGGQCLLLTYYILLVDNKIYDQIINWNGKNLKEYLFNDIIMYNCDEKSISLNDISINEDSIKVVNSLNEACNLFISIIIKEMDLNQNKQNNYNIKYYLDKLNTFNKLDYKKQLLKDNESIGWNLYFESQNNNTTTYIGLRNLGCTCYMNSLLQVFYHIIPLRESLLKCDCKEETKNSLYEVQKVFLYLKYLKRGHYVPETFVNNYDNEILNVHQQMDVDEFFSNILDKLENRLKNTENENLLKYFFLGRFNDTLTFQEGCNHHRTNVNDFYSIQLQVQNKKNIYESLDTLTEGELMNGDNCIFCPQCDKKFPAIKRQLFKTLPRMLMFVLKRFEFNFDTMTKFKINDYYEFPINLDMNKYTSEYNNKENTSQNNMYTLKSVVVHMGHSEGGHYYAFIKDNKTKNWYQFNDTSVTLFDIHNLAEETYGGKEPGSNEDKIRSAYLLFYEKIDQTNCEIFDKNKALNSLINKNEKNNNNEISNNDTKDEEDGFTLLNEDEQKNETNNNKINTITSDTKNNKDRFNKKEIIANINQQMLSDYLDEKLFSTEYHHFTLNLYINILNYIAYRNAVLPVFIETLCNINNEGNPFGNELISYRNVKPKGSNLTKYLKKGKIIIFNIIDDEKSKNSSEDTKEKIIELFKYILIEFFNIIIRSKEKKYLGCYVDLIKFLINSYEYCANYFLEELSGYNTIFEYIVNCTVYEIKKVIVGIINCAMIKSNQEYLTNIQKEKLNMENNNRKSLKKPIEKTPEIENKKNNKDNKDNKQIIENNLKLKLNKINNYKGFITVIKRDKQMLSRDEQEGAITTNNINEIKEKKDEDNKMENQSDEELAKKLEEEFKRETLYNQEKEGDEKLLENKNISPNVLKLVYNVLHSLKKIKLFTYKIEVRFLYAILLKFSLISSNTRDFLNKNVNISIALNYIICNDCLKNNYYYESDITSFDKGLFKVSHDILNPKPGSLILGEKDIQGQSINLDYDFMLLCNLIFYKEKKEEEIKKNHEDIGITFWNLNYILTLIRYAKTKQDLNYLSNLIKIKCTNNKVIFDKVLKVLEHVLENCNDLEDTFYDEGDEEKKYEIYKNYNCNSNSQSKQYILLRSNVTIIFKKLIFGITDNNEEYRIKTILSKLFTLFNKYKRYYGMTIVIVNIIIDLFEGKDMSTKYVRELNEVLSWLNKYKIPPKINEIKGIRMYKDEDLSRNYYYYQSMDQSFRKDFEKVEQEKANKKIERLNKILKNQNTSNIDISSLDCDVSDFKFTIGDQVIYNNKIYEITNCLDELIKIKLIKNNYQGDNKNDFIEKGFNKKKKSKEEKSIWVQTDDYKLRINKLVNTQFNNK